MPADAPKMNREARRRARLVERARLAMRLLTEGERAQLHAELGCCACAGAVDLAVRDPLVALGAVLGGGLAALARASGRREARASSSSPVLSAGQLSQLAGPPTPPTKK